MRIVEFAQTGITPYLAEDVFSLMLCYRLEQQGYVTVEPVGDWLESGFLESRFSLPIKISVILTDAGMNYITETDGSLKN